jgi:hypothetical protein
MRLSHRAGANDRPDGRALGRGRETSAQRVISRLSPKAGDLTVGPSGGVGSRDRFRFCRGIEIWIAPCVQRNHISIQESRPLPVLPGNRDMERALCTKEPYLNTGDPRPARDFATHPERRRADGRALGQGRESRPLPVLPGNRDLDRALCTKEPYLNTRDPRPARNSARKTES